MHLHTDWLLPPDLEFIIIDYFLGDKATLASCSLVCSRWLPSSRKHLFQDVTIQLRNNPNADPITDFLHTVETSGEQNPEWAIGTYVKKLKLEGRPISDISDVGTGTATFTLSVLRALLSKLPHLVSLYMTKFLVLDDTPQDPNGKQCQHPRFELDELTVSECIAGPFQDPHHLLALICTFSSIGSLSVDRWGQWQPLPLPTFPPLPFSPPVIRSLALNRVEEMAAGALYSLLSNSPSIMSACLVRISLSAFGWEYIQRLSAFATLAGAALRDLELRVDSYVRRLDVMHDTPFTKSTTLSSLTLSFKLFSADYRLRSTASHLAHDTRRVLHEYAQVLSVHRVALAGLTVIRLEMRPAGRSRLHAFVRVAQDIRRVGIKETVHPVEPQEAEWSRQVWVSLEDVLCAFPALERVEFVLYETSRLRATLKEKAKGALGSALKGRLPRLGPSGIARLVFEHCSR